MTTKLIIIFGIAITAAILLGGLAFSQSALAGGQPKVTICHVDQDTGEKKTITISNKAVEKHKEKHGDTVGECVDVPAPVCGNNDTEAPEECDDGGTADGDGCSAVCLIEFCGDGTVNDAPNEECDDGNTTPGDDCSSTCEDETTGSGTVHFFSCVCTNGDVINPNICFEVDCDSTNAQPICEQLCEMQGASITSATCRVDVNQCPP